MCNQSRGDSTYVSLFIFYVLTVATYCICSRGDCSGKNVIITLSLLVIQLPLASNMYNESGSIVMVTMATYVHVNDQGKDISLCFYLIYTYHSN